MAQPTRSNPALLPPDLDLEDDEDSLAFGWRYGRFRRADGLIETREIPLSADDLLNPRVGDHLAGDSRHTELSIMLWDMLQRRYKATLNMMVCFSMKIRWGVRRLPSPAPDVAVIPGVRDRDKYRNSFHVRQERAFPSLVIEVVSVETDGDERWRTDYVKKVDLYERAGVPVYMIVDPKAHLEQPLLRLTGYRLDARGRYRPIEPDAQGRLLAETVGLWFAVAPHGQDPWLIDAATGKRLLSASEIAAWHAAEERAAAVEAELVRLRQQLGISEPKP